MAQDLSLIHILPVRNFLDAVSAWKGLLSGDGGYFIAILRAQVAFIKWWLFYQKKSVFPVTKKGALSGYLQKNICLLYTSLIFSLLSTLIFPSSFSHPPHR